MNVSDCYDVKRINLTNDVLDVVMWEMTEIIRVARGGQYPESIQVMDRTLDDIVGRAQAVLGRISVYRKGEVSYKELKQKFENQKLTPKELEAKMVVMGHTMMEKTGAKVARDPVVEANREELLRRSEAGLNKYGIGLDRGDLTALQWLQHLREELLDAVNYVEALRQQIAKQEISEHHMAALQIAIENSVTDAQQKYLKELMVKLFDLKS